MTKLSSWKTTFFLYVFCAATAIVSPAQTVDTLFSFGGADGANPIAGLIQATDGNFYGTTSGGGSNGGGTVFEITPKGKLTTLHSFVGVPVAALVQGTDGNFYGTTSEGGSSGSGTIFKITPEGVLTTLHVFSFGDGFNPNALVQATDGNFYGTTYGGGSNEVGTVFKITPEGMLTTLHNFSGAGTGGSNPAALIQATDGNFYGTTSFGGGKNCTLGCGTVFKITPGGTLTTLHSYDGLDGAYSGAGLIQATDGDFYGTTGGDGSKNGGTVFKITPEGVLTTLHVFCSQTGCPNGGGPEAALVQGTDGNFYGTTVEGGSQNCFFGCGTIFKITPDGVLTRLHAFCSQTSCPDGAEPHGTLIQATDGNFYGTSLSSGSQNCFGGCGTVFTFGPPRVKLPSALVFGNDPLGVTSGAEFVRLTNIGTAALRISDVTITGNFAVSANTCTGAELTREKSCHVGLTFTPTTLGKQTGKLIFRDNADNSAQTVALSGTGK